MAKVLTPFNPPLNGFQFRNYFQYHFPVKIPLPFTGPVDLQDVVFGLCGGMAFSALDYFYARKPLPTYARPEDIDKKLFSYLCQRQLDSLSVSVLIQILSWMMAEDSDLAGRMTRVEIPRLRRLIDSGQPATLCLIRNHGLVNPTQNHQVVAAGYEVSADGKTITLTLYDPNHPCEEPTITAGLTKTGFAIAQSTGEPLRGFFNITYTAQGTVPAQAAQVVQAQAAAPQTEALSFAMVEPTTAAAEAAGFRLHWPVDSHSVNQYFGEHPENYRGFGLPGHEGVDLYALTGSSVYACADGEVIEAGPRIQPHPYGTQIRIRHVYQGQEYETVYAHLQSVFVQVGQTVQAGQRIGQADNTGNSFGSHLHLTLKKTGAKTTGYPDGIVDPWPYLQGQLPPPAPSGITVYTNCQTNLRQQPNTVSAILTLLPVGELLSTLGDANTIHGQIGQPGQWLQVQTAGGTVGYLAAWLVTESGNEAFPPSGLVVYPIESVNLRSGPGTAFNLLGTMVSTDPLSVLGDADTARARIGQMGQWLQVKTQSGAQGFIAAWLVHLTGQIPPACGLVVYPTTTINVRARPSTDANVLVVASPGDALSVMGDKTQALALIGQQGQWLQVQTPAKVTGYAAAWLVRAGSTPPPPVSGLTVHPTAEINLRAQPSANSPRVNGAHAGDPLTVVETDLNAAQAKIGKQDLWIYVQKKDGTRGWAAAWYLAL